MKTFKDKFIRILIDIFLCLLQIGGIIVLFYSFKNGIDIILCVVLIALLFATLIHLYNIFTTRKNKNDDVIFVEPKEKLSLELVDMCKKIESIDEYNNRDKQEIEKLVIPIPTVEKKGNISITKYKETLSKAVNISLPHRPRLTKYLRRRWNFKRRENAIESLVSTLGDTTLFETVSDTIHLDSFQSFVENILENLKDVEADVLGDSVTDNINSTIEGGLEHIPFYTSVNEIIKQIKKFNNGDITVGDAFKQSGTKIGLKAVFTTVGTTLGSITGGPGGALVGSILGSYLANVLSHEIKTSKLKNDIEELKDLKDSFKTFVDNKEKEFNEAYNKMYSKINEDIAEINSRFEKAKQNPTPIDKYDRGTDIYSVCIVLKDWLLDCSKYTNDTAFIEYIPSNLKNITIDKIKSLLYACELLQNKNIKETKYYNNKYVINSCISQLKQNLEYLLLSQDEWIINMYEEYNSSILDIAEVVKREQQNCEIEIGKIKQDLDEQAKELGEKRREIEKEVRKVK